MPFDFWTYYWAFVSFVFGAITGSFLNVCIWRLPRGESLVHPPSHCPNCNNQLRFWPDMVPILSQLWFRSKCRHCQQKFSWRYLWVEIFTALVFTALYFRYVPFGAPEIPEVARDMAAIPGMIFAGALIAVFFIDLEKFFIPDLLVGVAFLAAVARDLVLIGYHVRPLWQTIPGTPWSIPVPISILAGLLAFWALWQFAALTSAALGREAMGGGDSLLLGAMGAYLVPWPLVVVAFLFAVSLGTVGGIAGILLAARQDAGETPSTTEPAASGSEPDVHPVAVVEPAEAGEPERDPVAGHRGAAAVTEGNPPPEADGSNQGDQPPTLPAGSRWGRVWEVLATWVLVGGVWWGAALAAHQPALGIGSGVVGTVVGVLLFRYGMRMRVESDPAWTDAMDELFEEGEPGPRFIPFGPYLVAGTFLAILFGRQLVEWYLNTLSPGVFPHPFWG